MKLGNGDTVYFLQNLDLLTDSVKRGSIDARWLATAFRRLADVAAPDEAFSFAQFQLAQAREALERVRNVKRYAIDLTRRGEALEIASGAYMLTRDVEAALTTNLLVDRTPQGG